MAKSQRPVGMDKLSSSACFQKFKIYQVNNNQDIETNSQIQVLVGSQQCHMLQIQSVSVARCEKKSVFFKSVTF